MMTLLSIAMVVALLSAAFVVLRWPTYECMGDTPLPTLSFLAILFTSGLDVGLIMFPLIDFETYATGADYSFASPLVIEFGFWGGLVWGFYFLTTLYFCAIEPRLKLFELTPIRWVHNLVVIATCAFTAYLFLAYLPSYIEGIGALGTYLLVGSVIVLAVVSSTRLAVLRVLSLSSTGLFFVLIAFAWVVSGVGIGGLFNEISGLSDYLTNLDRFVLPINDYHGFYLSWWFAWSIMIGQFVARFVNGMAAWKLFIAILIVPSIPIALWFSVLYGYFAGGIPVSDSITLLMIVVGVLFVINSLDSLTRLYSQNLGLTVEALGRPRYVVTHAGLLGSLVVLYQFTPLKIEWIGMIVIGLYVA
ncbi:MAG: BCCT family transporter, partial [Luminiphilus sp.]|nr:BCCT family transporter [Luminiphilus sp.]